MAKQNEGAFPTLPRNSVQIESVNGVSRVNGRARIGSAPAATSTTSRPRW